MKIVAFCYLSAAVLLPLCRPGDSAPVNVKWIARLGSSLPRWLIDPPVNTTAGEIHKAGKCYLNVRLLCARSLKHLRALEVSFVFFLFFCNTRFIFLAGCILWNKCFLTSCQRPCGEMQDALTKKHLVDVVGSPEVPALWAKTDRSLYEGWGRESVAAAQRAKPVAVQMEGTELHLAAGCSLPNAQIPTRIIHLWQAACFA